MSSKKKQNFTPEEKMDDTVAEMMALSKKAEQKESVKQAGIYSAMNRLQIERK